MRIARKVTKTTLEALCWAALGAVPAVVVACANPPSPGDLFREAHRGLLAPATCLFVDSDLNGHPDKAVVRLNASDRKDGSASATVTINGNTASGTQGSGDDVIHIVVPIPEDTVLTGKICYTNDSGHKYEKGLEDLTP